MITIYTDGAAKGNPGIAGWGVFIQFDKKEYIMSGNIGHSTNNIAEMSAVLEALKKVTDKKRIIKIHTDSTYVQKGITEWRKGWERKAFKGVKNSELWKTIFTEVDKHKSVEVFHVKAHNGDYGNEIADELASDAAMGIEVKFRLR